VGGVCAVVSFGAAHDRRSFEMPKMSRESAPNVDDHGAAEDRHDDLDGYSVSFVTIRETHDLATMLKGLPNDSCQCPHWATSSRAS
jgi:hypothetical protein